MAKFDRAASTASYRSVKPPLSSPAAAFAHRGKLPRNTNGGGLSYMHSGMYALQESVRQMRGTAAAQIRGAQVSVCHGVGGMFAASGTVIMANEAGL